VLRPRREGFTSALTAIIATAIVIAMSIVIDVDGGTMGMIVDVAQQRLSVQMAQ
jgi:hypothetical protein